MKKVFTLALLTLLSNVLPVRAVEWHEISSNEEEAEYFYVDLNSIRRDRNIVWYRAQRVQFNEQKRVNETELALFSANCRTGQFRARERILSGAGGVELGVERLGDRAPLRVFAPGTVGYAAFEFACSR